MNLDAIKTRIRAAAAAGRAAADRVSLSAGAGVSHTRKIGAQ